MASGNYLTVKTHLSEFKNNSDKDTVSEASESGTSNSTSAEDLQKLAVILGLNSVEDVYQERFRVDRRRLETMLADPHVRVAGRVDDVKLAREKIMQLLDTRSNRVTMKIDVSYTDHSHIIGKGGLTIKRVMEETGCHIHFPDSNRTSSIEKSNQVSIAGDMERVERARARVRALTPLVFCFELPIVAPSQPLPDINSPYVQQIQEQYNVQVMLRNRPKLHANLLVVKGVQWEVQGTMEATGLLMNYMCGQLAMHTSVQMTLEISPIHHSVVVGRAAEQLKVIMKGTNTEIMFPDADDPNIPVIKKSCVTIKGQIKDVYAARQQLMGSLPLVVIFDVSEEAYRLDPEAAIKLMQKYNVYINIRRKPKQGIASVVIKGIERCAGDIYEARRELLGGNEPVITAEVPESYNIPAFNTAMPNFGVYNPFSPSHPLPNITNSPCSPYNLQLELANFNIGSPMYNQPPTPGGYPSPLSPVAITPPVYPNAWIIPSPQPRAGQFHYPSMGVPNPSNVMYKNQGGSWNPLSSGADMSTMQQPMVMQQAYQQIPEGRPTTLSQLLNSSSQASSGYQSNFTGSSVSLDTHNISGGESSNIASPSVSPISSGKTHSPAPSADTTDRSQQEIASIISDMPLSERRAPGCEKKTLETLGKLSPLTEYRKMKAEASKAMQEKVGSNYRMPTPRWSGYFFSHTSPGPINLKDANTTPDKAWNRSDLVRPNIVEKASPSPPQAIKPCRYTQLYDLLRDIGLHKYIDLFKKHELDMSTFASLNEADLTEIGVTAFGARRKMLLIIAELQQQASQFKGSAAPGAERKLIQSPQYNTGALVQVKW
ncbi:hypothetical protein MSG28_013012 [Choristoneura fumiferana]|uniref:Uncharacterized protein n=1 Tax=Choristoneura fumiferana TaxID=7141 RepID=A0ACC0KS81_CHOFU|nr:hypothetical protein MSG28_013012 [Choristoneura fumiferana]